MDRLQTGCRVLVNAGAGPAPDPLIRGADIEHLVARRRHHPEDLINVLRKLAKLLFAKLESLLGLLALGDVRTDSDMPQEFAIRREARLGERVQPPPLAIGAPDARFGLERRMLPHGPVECRNVLRRIVRVKQQLPLALLHLFTGYAAGFPVRPIDKLILAL